MSGLSERTRSLLSQCSAASVSTQLVRRGLRNTAIRGVAPLHRDLPPMVGPAFTLRYIPAREDLDVYGRSNDPANPQRQSIEIAPAGSVLVVDCRGVTDAAGIGSILTRRLKARNLAGAVLDGGVRDTTSIATFGFPLYCAGAAAPANFVAHHAADVGRPIGCGGVPVFPDDVIFGDAEAVIVIPRHLVDEVAEDAAAMEHRETFLMSEIVAGRSWASTRPTPRPWRATRPGRPARRRPRRRRRQPAVRFP